MRTHESLIAPPASALTVPSRSSVRVDTVAGSAVSPGDYTAITNLVLAFAAASMLYVAVADLIPTLHRRFSLSDTLQQMVMIGLGVATVTFTHSLLHAGH